MLVVDREPIIFSETLFKTMNSFFRIRSITKYLLASVIITSVAGCGGDSKEDMIALRMQRRRSNVDDDNEKPRPPSPPVVAQTAAPQPTNASLSPTQETTPTQPASLDAVSATLIPIEQRMPAEPLSQSERRKRSVENLKKINAAIVKYTEKRTLFPPRKTRTSSGFDGLSWRVLILPQLGYDELYAKFDLSKRWDEEPNISLLKFIPDEFVSPERFDDKTNYMVPVGRAFVFEDRKSASVGQIEDGVGSTIFLLEVDDKLAAPWIKPDDFEFNKFAKQPAGVTDVLGNLRGDGIFAIWGGGLPTMLSPSLATKTLTRAFEIDDGSSSLPATIHQDITFESGPEEMAEPKPMGAVFASASVDKPSSMSEKPMMAEMMERSPLPSQIEIDRAILRVRELYDDQLVSADDPTQHANLSTQLLRAASQLESDPVGMYALISVCQEQSILGGSPNILLDAVDLKILHFEVDAYQTNLNALASFSKQNSRSFPLRQGNSRELLGRIVRTISAAFERNDYDGARDLCRLGIRTSNLPKNSSVPTLFNKLAVSMSKSGAIYDRVKGSLETLRADPDHQQANATVGRFLCFIKGDWEAGLPLLKIGDSGDIGVLAARDLAGASSEAEQITIGDAWWKISQSTTAEVFRNGSIDRAMHWYRMAFDTLTPSLDRMHVQARLNENEVVSQSPKSLLEELADATNVDLEIPLSDVKTRSRRNNDDDEDVRSG